MITANIPPGNKNIKEIALELSLEYKESVSRFRDRKKKLDELLVKLAVIAAWLDFNISSVDTFFLKDFFLLYLGFEEYEYTPILRKSRMEVQNDNFAIDAASLPEGLKIFAFRFWLAISKADPDLLLKMGPVIDSKTREIKNKLFESENQTIKSDPVVSLQDEGRELDSKEIEKDDKRESLEDVLDELNNLVGLANLKKEIFTLINFLKIQKMRLREGLPYTQISFHSVFSGNPGTGKTTVGRLFGRALKAMGFIKKGHLIETDRAGLVGQYIGHTALKTDSVIKNALDGVLFIDEAYALNRESDRGSDFGKEAIDTMIKRMEDYRDRLVIIVAGYTKEIKAFINSNPGLESRFSNYFQFPDYDPEELFNIFLIFCEKENYQLRDSAGEKLRACIEGIFNNRDQNFGNARIIRNLFQRIIRNQANRLSELKRISKDDLLYLEPEDVPKSF